MRLWHIALFVLIGPISAPADELPFAPVRVTVDYVATLVQTSTSSAGRSVIWSIKHGGDWTRVGAPSDGDPQASEPATYFDAANRLHVKISVDDSQRRSVTVTRNPRPSWQARRDRPSFKTEEKDTALGEECDVWTVFQLEETTTLSCVARDGIELWRKMVSRRSGTVLETRLTHLERRPVAPGEVQPPAGLLTLTQDMIPGASEETLTMPDHEVVLRENHPRVRNIAPVITTTRQRCPWAYEEVRAGDTQRDISIQNWKAGFQLAYAHHQADGFERLTIGLRAGTGECGPPGQARWLGLVRSEMVLGNLCNWYDLTPGMADAGRTACLTLDNVMLKRKAWSRGVSNYYDREATSLRRGPVDTKDISLPPELLSTAHWGLPR